MSIAHVYLSTNSLQYSQYMKLTIPFGNSLPHFGQTFNVVDFLLLTFALFDRHIEFSFVSSNCKCLFSDVKSHINSN